MIWTLVRKELLTNLLTFRLAVALIFTVVLSALTTVIGSLDFSRNMDAYEKEMRDYQERQAKVTIYRQLEPNIIVPPQPLSILSKGVMRSTGLRYYFGIDFFFRTPWQLGTNFDSEYMKTLVQIDFVTVVALLLSFLAVILGFDAICGERERGTLKQLLTNSIPRAHIVLAKLMGGMLSLWIPFAVAFVICLLICLANSDVVFSGDDWARLALLFVLSCLFLGQIFALSLMVSSLTRDSDTALIICLFAWLVAGVGYINALPSFARYGYDEPPFQEFLDQNRALWDNLGETMNEWEEKNPSPGEAYLRGIERDGLLRYAHPKGYEWMQRRNEVEWDKRLELADRRGKYRWANQKPLAQEGFLVDEWGIVSPFTSYQVLSYMLARTTLDDLLFMGRAGMRYRETIISYLRSKNAFASRRWFSDDPPGQEPMIAAPEEVTAEMLAADSPFMRERMAWAEEQEKKAAEDDSRKLGLTDVPKFGGDWNRSLAASLGVMMPGLVVLLLSFGGAVMIAVMRFLRYDPR